MQQIKRYILKEADENKAIFSQRFFKTGKGEYADGDVFLGLTVPQSRKIVARYKDLSLKDCIKLLHSKIHEERLIALLILVFHFAKASRDKHQDKQKKIFDFYLANTKYINNWDLVDLSADKIVGEYLTQFVIASTAKQSNFKQGIATSPTAPRNDEILVKLAKFGDLWERRIAMIATFAFIKQGKHEETFKIADILLDRMTASNVASATSNVASHDLLHKAVGWMLREKLAKESLKKA